MSGGSVVDEQIFSTGQDLESLEQEIKRKIDAIFAQQISESRFVRSSFENVEGGHATVDMRQLVAHLESFRDSLIDRRQELRTVIEQIRSLENLHPLKAERPLNEQVEMVQTIQKVGSEVGPVLDRLLSLTQRMLDDLSTKE